MSDIFLCLMIIFTLRFPLFVNQKYYLIESYDESIQDINDNTDASRKSSRSIKRKSTNTVKKEIEKKYPGYKLFEGDMILSPNQQKKFRPKSSFRNSALQKMHQARVGHQWPNNKIYYTFDNTVEENFKNDIRSGLKELAELLNGCIKVEEGISDNFVTISAERNGECVSMVGVNKEFSNTLNLDPDGCNTKARIQHEFIHSLGIYHHQSRKDRDQYIKINWHNIQTEPENMTHNFQIQEDSNTFNLPYDYESIMHYGANAFSKNGAPTIETKNPVNQKIIGVQSGISPGDIKLIKAYYKCGGACPTVGCDMQTIVDFPEVITRSWQECQASCHLIPKCTHWAWRSNSWHNCPRNHGKRNGCHRKISTGDLAILPCQTDGMICGPRECAPPEQPTPGKLPPPPIQPILPPPGVLPPAPPEQPTPGKLPPPPIQPISPSPGVLPPADYASGCKCSVTSNNICHSPKVCISGSCTKPELPMCDDFQIPPASGCKCSMTSNNICYSPKVCISGSCTKPELPLCKDLDVPPASGCKCLKKSKKICHSPKVCISGGCRNAI